MISNLETKRLPLLASCLICNILLEDNKNLLCSCCEVELQKAFARKPFRASIYGDRVFFAFQYVDFVRKMVLTFKYSKCCQISCILAEKIWSVIKTEIAGKHSVILPVPSNWQKMFVQKFNPPDLIARELSHISDLPVWEHVLKKKSMWIEQKQSLLSSANRIANPSLKFHAKQVRFTMFKPSCWVVLDDVSTTGATLHACKNALLYSYPDIPVLLVSAAHG